MFTSERRNKQKGGSYRRRSSLSKPLSLQPRFASPPPLNHMLRRLKSAQTKWLTPPLSVHPSFRSMKEYKMLLTLDEILAGAIIGDGDLKRAPFQVLWLSPWYGTVILFLEHIAPSPAAHARTCCEDFCGCRAGEMASEIPEMYHMMFLPHNSTRLRLLEFCLSIFVVSCSSLSEVRQCRI